MKKSPRLERVQKQLTSLQIAMLDIKAAHRHGSLVAHARVLASELEKPTRAETIEMTTRARCHGMSHEEMRDATRAAQKEVGFLYRLAVETWWSVATNHRVWMANTAAMKLAHALVQEMAHGEQASAEELATAIDTWHAFVHDHLNELRAELEAAHLIEREYFGGASIMFESDERMLSELIREVTREAAVAAGAKAALEVSGAPRHLKQAGIHSNLEPDLEERAAALANRRADLARVWVLDRVGEQRAATSLLQGVMQREASGDRKAERVS